tara:strand:+ start:888 stop:1040 length:153 start_codon:yes stop_codon:yes gene_type:complete
MLDKEQTAKYIVIGKDTVVGARVMRELNILNSAILGSLPTIESGIPIKKN